MSGYKVSERAKSDLDGIWSYIATNDERAADRTLDALVEKFEFLGEFPESGAVREDMATNPRCFTVGSYVIYYRHTHNTVNIARVLHGSRDAHTIFEAEAQ